MSQCFSDILDQFIFIGSVECDQLREAQHLVLCSVHTWEKEDLFCLEDWKTCFLWAEAQQLLKIYTI